MKKRCGLVLLSLAFAASLAGVCAEGASAATAEVREEHGSVNRSILRFADYGGDDNHLKLSAGAVEAERIEIELFDPTSALSPGPGCDQESPPGGPVVCSLHEPMAGDVEVCGKSCVRTTPGTAWTLSMSFALGHGDDILDPSVLAGPLAGASFNVQGGPGDDTIVTAGGADLIDAGAGNDEVHSEGGKDVVRTKAEDGQDRYDLGPHNEDLVSYEGRTTPVLMSGRTAGAENEGDTLEATEYVAGGDGNDRLLPSEDFRGIAGGDGDDVLVGGDAADDFYGEDGDDLLRGNGGHDRLYGGDGSDRLEGGADGDYLSERAMLGKNRFAGGPGWASGADIGDGGTGDDIVVLGPGPDEAEGGEGDDEIYGGKAADRLAGGGGDDMVAGEAGPDRLWGGTGKDILKAGRRDERRYAYEPHLIDSWRDFLDCGLGPDRAIANPWDRRRRCERVQLVRAATLIRLKRFPAWGSVWLTVEYTEPGTLAMFGKGVRKVVEDTGEPSPGLRRLHIPIRPKGRALAALHRQGRAWVRIALRFRTAEGFARTERRSIRLVRRPYAHRGRTGHRR